MKDSLETHVEQAFEIAKIRPDVRCETLDSILGVVVNKLFRKNLGLSDFASDLVEFGGDCNSSSLSYIRMPA